MNLKINTTRELTIEPLLTLLMLRCQEYLSKQHVVKAQRLNTNEEPTKILLFLRGSSSVPKVAIPLYI